MASPGWPSRDRRLRSARMKQRAPGNLRRTIAFSLAAAALAAPSVAPAQTLRRASDAVHTGSSEPRRSRDDSASGSSSSTPSQPSSSRPSRWYRPRYFLPYPYAWGYGGYSGYEPPSVVLSDPSPRPTRRVAVVASLDGGLALSDIGRGGVGLRVLGSAFEFEVRYSAFAESDRGQTLWAGLGRYRGAFVLGDAAGLRLRLFGGLLHWVDDGGSEFGAEGGLGLDAFPGAPWVLSFDLSGGFVGRAGLIGLRGTVGYMVGPVEFQVGWQHESVIPTIDGPTVDLSGPLAGVRLWL